MPHRAFDFSDPYEAEVLVVPAQGDVLGHAVQTQKCAASLDSALVRPLDERTAEARVASSYSQAMHECGVVPGGPEAWIAPLQREGAHNEAAVVSHEHL